MTRRHLLWTSALSPLVVAQTEAQTKPLTAGELLARIQKQTGVEWKDPKTVDTFKSGSVDTVVTGIATTFLATHKVLAQAAAKKLNFVISHEPTFYNHLDDVQVFEKDAIYQAKRALIDRNNMVVFRFHDYWHRVRPDGIRKGMVDAMGWGEFADGNLFRFPKKPSLADVASDLKKRLRAGSVRVIGDPAQQIGVAAMMPGAGGSPGQMRLVAREDVDLLVIGETREWETVEYVRDAVDQGRKKSMIILGHAISEESGMVHCASWLKEFVKEVPVEFIAAGEPYWPAK